MMFSRKYLLFGRMGEWNTGIRRRLDQALYQADYLSDSVHAYDPSSYDAFIPMHFEDHELVWSQDLKNAIAPSRDHAFLAGNKISFNNWMIRSGFDRFVPQVYDTDIRFPCVLKRSQDAFGRRTRIIHDRHELSAALRTGEYEVSYCQELVESDREYTTHILCWQGEIHFALTFGFLFGTKAYVKGISGVGEIFSETRSCRPELAEIVRALGYSGIACFNYKLSDNRPQIFEMNPRFGGSLAMSVNAFLPAYLGLLSRLVR